MVLLEGMTDLLKNRIKWRIYLGLFLSPLLAFSSVPDVADSHRPPDLIHYCVKKGDDLSDILKKFRAGPIWGPGSTVKEMIRLNPYTVHDHGNLIFPKTLLKLPVADDSSEKFSHNQKLECRDESLTSIDYSDVLPFESGNELASELSELIPSEPFHVFHRISVAPLVSYSKVSATDSTTSGMAEIGSNLNFGLELGWHQVWSPKLEISALLRVKNSQYSAVDTAHFLDNSDHIFTQLTVQLRRKLSSNFGFGANLQLSQEPFIRGESLQANVIDSVLIPGFSLFAFQNLNFIKPLHLILEETLTYLVATTEPAYSIQSGYAFNLALFLKEESESKKILKGSQALLGLFFRQVCQNTSITTQSAQELGLMLLLYLN